MFCAVLCCTTGKNALEIFLLLLVYQLAEPRAIYINRGNHEQRDLNERPFTAGEQKRQAHSSTQQHTGHSLQQGSTAAEAA